MDLSDIDLLARTSSPRASRTMVHLPAQQRAGVQHPEPDGPGFWVITKHEDVGIVGRDAKTFSSAAKYGGVVGLEEIRRRRSAKQELEAAGRAPGQHDAVHGPSGSHAVPEDRARRVPSPDDLGPRGDDPRARHPHPRRRDREGVVRLRRRRRRGAAAAGDRRAARRPDGGPAQALRLVEPDDRQRGPGVRGERGARPQRADRDVHVREGARRRPPREPARRHRHDAAPGRGRGPLAVRARLQPVLPAALGRRQRDDAQRDLARHGCASSTTRTSTQILVEDPSVIDLAVEEIVRWASPVMYFRRNVTQDTEIRGVPIKAGDKVSLWYISANRDEDVFDEPFKFDVRRDPNEHIAFGHGHHFCLGFNLARLEIKVLFEELAKRVTKIESVGDISRLRSNFIAGIKHLPVRFTDVRQPAGV